MEKIKIFVIGNGFDLQHNLPTRYSDFLNFCNVFLLAKKEEFSKISKEEFDRNCEFKMDNPSLYQEFMFLMDCYWVNYFIVNRANIGDKWLNFETEIETVVKRLMSDREKEKRNSSSVTPLSSNVRIKFMLPDLKTYSAVFEYLSKELKRLERALEIYLSYEVPKRRDIERRMSLFANLKPDKLLSFNYTSTYFDYYCPTREIEYAFVHGAADHNGTIDNCNLVIGYDDHYFDNNAVLELVPFEKYYQRIVNRTGADYIKWINELDKNAREKQKEIYFYGHSMSPADGDIIKTLMCCPRAKTTIFYRKGHEEERAEMIKNLAIVLTPEELIKRTGEHGGTITFEAIE